MVPAERHVVLVKQTGTLRAYVGYAQRVLADPAEARVRLEAVGRSVGKAVSVAEILKRARPALHQVAALDAAPDGRARLSILLAVSADAVDPAHPGYAAPAE